MTDLIFLAIMVAFFAVAVAFVKGCELIVGPDTDAPRVEQETTAADESIAA